MIHNTKAYHKILVWDLPTRVFHGLLTAGFIAAASLAFLTDGESRLFPYHAIIGLVLTLLVALRAIWGFLGTRYARFASFVFGPRALVVYLKESLGGGGMRYLGHNPGSAYAIFAMLVLLPGISLTGIMLSRGHEAFKEAHEVMSYAMIAVVAAHILGVVFHTIRHRENITLSMLHGKKAGESSEAIASGSPIAAAVFLALLGVWTGVLISSYDGATRTATLPLMGTGLQLGEYEKDGSPGKPDVRQKRQHDDE